jgi:pimeloyl-ACP methyl ester carboxylesterase
LYIFFGGMAGAIGMPPFEFYRVSGVLPFSRIFLRDLHQAWYLRGLPSLASDVTGVGEYLANKITTSGAAEVYFVGNSMGGFAALLFCAMLKHGKVIAFAPQTFISKEKRRKHGDHRWSQRIAKLHAERRALDIQDLHPWISDRFPDIEASLYVSTCDALDVQHADRLAQFRNITIHYIPTGGHRVVSALRDRGLLNDILH